MRYVSGFVTPVADADRDAYRASAEAAWAIFRDYGATGQMEAWGDDVPPGKQTDFARAVALKDGESVALGWILWPDKATAERCFAAMESDPRFAELPMPFDGSRMIYGGFVPIFSGGVVG
ncbi:RNA signal recognition particle [Sphingomonas sp. Leaf407]|uniref:DUF1428 domain-containing protein n=1 Tax=unclassified Sphingomonas TaxID=196159 RepID=UPI0006FF6D79|nr:MULTISPECIES: DUF1428 domain-containing protein [unclassified Sphingomonas]KQN35519.1 RNA signal recognition particle [Sphingomonas sp. Leaf42]KQT26386.1 RNA signal recognition particle [Sphingomonas sp. Leaf407]